MKTFWKILAGIIALLILIFIGLNLYFTNDRLQQMIMPKVNQAVGREVHVGDISLAFFSTFPQLGVSIEDMSIPGDAGQDTVMTLNELDAGIAYSSIFGDEIKITELQLDRPRFTYKVYKDSTTNIDFLLNSNTTDTSSSTSAINIPHFEINNGQFGYLDETSATDVRLHDTNAELSLRYADLIDSDVDINVGKFYATVDSSNYVSGLPLSLTEKSTLDTDKEMLKLNNGTFSIRGLDLDLSGTIKNWSNTPTADLTFTSSSDDFGDLLRLAPKKYSEGLDTKGSLAINGSLNGPLGGNTYPQFNITAKVKDGYIKNPDLPQPVENIQLDAQANNDLLQVKTLNAKAGNNSLSGNGQLTKPLEENGTFDVDFKADVNLSTVKDFYDIKQFGLDKLGGNLNVDAQAKGNRSNPKAATFNGMAKLANGSLKYEKVDKPIDHISMNVQGDQSKVTIGDMQLKAASNTFSMNGTVQDPLRDDQRTINLQANLKFDLATLKDFYPIDEDTLAMRGSLTAKATLQGKAKEIERAVQKGSVSLKNGYIKYKKLGKPVEDLTLSSTLDGPVMKISDAHFTTGDNKFSVTGTITDYLSDDRAINLDVKGNANLAELKNYYDLSSVSSLDGKANINLNAKGPLSKPSEMKLDGQLSAQNVNMKSADLGQPVQNLNGQLTLSPSDAKLKSLSFMLGSSDINLEGSMQHYMALMKEVRNRQHTPHLEGSYTGNVLNLDELIDWDDTTSEPYSINLPNMTSSIKAHIDKLIVTGITMKNLDAQASTTPNEIDLNQGSVDLFDGHANGSFVWKVPQPEQTNISFKGSLDSLQASSFFKAYPILGQDSQFGKYLSGAFSADVDYFTKLDKYLQPILSSSTMDGTMSMSKASLQDYPLQVKVANFLKADQLKKLSLDTWKSDFKLNDNVLTFNDLNLTSGDIGLSMNGSQNLAKGNIDYQAKVLLPQSFKGTISSVIPSTALDVLSSDDDKLNIPLQLTGTFNSPKISVDQSVIKNNTKNALQNKAKNALKNLLNGGNKNKADTTSGK